MKVKDIVNKFTWNNDVNRIVFKHAFSREDSRALTPIEYYEKKLGRYREADNTVVSIVVINNELIIYYK